MKTLLVLGASGEMGQRIVRLGRRLLPGVRVIEGSRRASPASPDRRQVDIHDRDSLARALEDVDALINAVGPYDYDPTPLVASCLDAGCHYIDIAETAEFLLAVERATRNPAAVARRACVISGCSTIPGLVQVLAQHWADRDDVHCLRILLSMGSANPVSPTLLFSLLRPLGSRAPDGSRYFDRLVRKTPLLASPRLYGRFPSSFDATGIRFGNRVLPATLYVGMDRDVLDRVLWLSAKVLPALSSRVLKRLCRLSQPFLLPVRTLGTPVGVLALEAIGERTSLLNEIEVRADREGLNIPALPSLWAVRRLLGEDDLPDEAMSLDQLITPQQAATWLRQEGYAVHGVLGE
jgi:saccharopine dehydrogenase-like protein